MFNVSDFNEKLAARLAGKTGLSKDQAQKIMYALAEITREDEQQNKMLTASPDLGLRFFAKYDKLPGQLPTHVISIPVIEHEDGSIAVDKSSYAAWTPITRPGTRPKSADPKPIDPPADPGKPRQIPAPGGYPGPSVFLKMNDWLGNDLDLGSDVLVRLRTAFTNFDFDTYSK
jgi:hypothetical protein